MRRFVWACSTRTTFLAEKCGSTTKRHAQRLTERLRCPYISTSPGHRAASSQLRKRKWREQSGRSRSRKDLTRATSRCWRLEGRAHFLDAILRDDAISAKL